MAQPQKVWGWTLGLETFFASTGAGAYIAIAAADLSGFVNLNPAAILSIAAGLLLIAFSAIILVIDLGNKMHSRYVLSNLKSPMAIGTIAIASFFVISVFTMGLWLDALRVEAPVRRGVEVLGSILALIVLLYPGLLLGVLKNIPFFNSPILPLLFLASGLASGIALVQILLSALSNPALMTFLTQVNIAAVSAFGLSILLQLVVKWNSVPAAREAVRLLVQGRFTLPFWLGVVIVGAFLPLILYAASLQGTIILMAVAGVCALLGGITTRILILAVGVPMPIPIATGAINVRLE